MLIPAREFIEQVVTDEMTRGSRKGSMLTDLLQAYEKAVRYRLNRALTKMGTTLDSNLTDEQQQSIQRRANCFIAWHNTVTLAQSMRRPDRLTGNARLAYLCTRIGKSCRQILSAQPNGIQTPTEPIITARTFIDEWLVKYWLDDEVIDHLIRAEMATYLGQHGIFPTDQITRDQRDQIELAMHYLLDHYRNEKEIAALYTDNDFEPPAPEATDLKGFDQWLASQEKAAASPPRPALPDMGYPLGGGHDY